MIKKFISVLMVIITVFLFTGCWNAVGIDKMEFVAAVAIDKGIDGCKYTLSAELINLDKEAEEPSKIVEASADSIFDATRELITITSRKLYYGHCKAVIISEEVAKEGIEPVLDILMRFFTSRIALDLFISKDVKAKDILAEDSFRKSPNGFEIDTMIENIENSLSNSEKMELFCVVNEIETAGKSATIPVATIRKIDDKNYFTIAGIAIFSHDKLVGYLNDDESKYFNMIAGKVKSTPLTVNLDEEEDFIVSAQILDNKSSINYEVINDKIVIKININSKVNIGEIGSNNHESLEKLQYSKISEKLEIKSESKINNLMKKIQNQYNCDVFGFGKKIYQKDPELWKVVADKWDKEIFRNLKVEVICDYEICHTGLIEKDV